MPDVIIPHAVLSCQVYGLRAMEAVVSAWARLAQGQWMDHPSSGSQAAGARVYRRILAYKSAPLFQVACELGVLAAGRPRLARLARTYGFHLGMAFQVMDDACDLQRGLGLPWEAMATGGVLPSSLQALRATLGGSDLVTTEDCAKAATMAARYLDKAREAAYRFPESPVKQVIGSFAEFCCLGLLGEQSTAKESPAGLALGGTATGRPG